MLAGVIALSALTSSFALALGLGSAYVFGIVAPLFVISLLWERFDWRSSAEASAELQHYGRVLTEGLSWIPGWAGALLVMAAVALLARRALRQTDPGSSSPSEEDDPSAGLTEESQPIEEASEP